MMTDKEIKAFKADGTTQKKPDGVGLYLCARRKGKKVWISHYSIRGKQDDLLIGTYPVMTLAEARRANME